MAEFRARIRYLLISRTPRTGSSATQDNSGANRTLNLLALAASRGQTSTLDPTLAKFFADMRSAASRHSRWSIACRPEPRKYNYSPGGEQYRHFPTGRIDYNSRQPISSSGPVPLEPLRSGADVLNSNEPAFPGFPNQGGQARSATLAGRSVDAGQDLVNESRYGWRRHDGLLRRVDRDAYSTFGCRSLAGGYAFDINNSSVGGGGNEITASAVDEPPRTRYTPVTTSTTH